jgi:Ca2+-binding EF-hand superfamily protein
MNKLLVGGAAAALVFAVGAATAQPAPPPPPGVASGTAPMAMPRAAPHARMMVMSNRDMTRDEVARHVGEMFAHLDANHDGFITRDEMAAVHQRMTAMRGERAKRPGGHAMPNRAAMFDRLDTNHDGSLSRQEYLAARPEIREQRVFVIRDDRAAGMPGMAAMDHMKMRMHGAGMAMGGMHGMGGHMFDKADVNHDGRVSLAEAQALALAHFDRADVNHDGRITREERKQVRQIRIERRTS